MKKHGIWCNRVGPMNAQKQNHRDFNPAPVTRGIWAFPYPIFDYFFVSHQVDKFKKKEDEDVSEELWKRLKRNEMKIRKIFWDKPFYSALRPDDKLPEGARWYLWEDHKKFSKRVKKETSYMIYHNGVWRKQKTSIDHLEIFLPMKNEKLPYIVW